MVFQFLCGSFGSGEWLREKTWPGFLDPDYGHPSQIAAEILE